MKKMFALIAICAMASSLMAVEFTDANYKNGALTIPVVYTGMLKLNGWGDEGLCYNWRSNRNSYPLFLGLCQPCLDCVPCDIDMRHLPSTVQYGTWLDGEDGVANADPNGRHTIGQKSNVDETEAFFNRARLYVVTGTTPAKKATATQPAENKKVTIKVIDLIDAYWGKDEMSATPVLFQFFNTVDSVDRREDGAASRGRIGAMYQFPIYSRNFSNDDYALRINDFADKSNLRHNNTAALDCIVDRFEDGVGLAALIGTKDYKSFFKVKEDGKSVSYKIVSIKSFSGDFFAWQRNYANVENDQFKYACRKGEQYVLYKNTTTVPSAQNTQYDGKGAWYATGSITLRRNDSVSKNMMQDIFKEGKSVTCIPCNHGEESTECRSYLDQGMVDYLINRQYKGWDIIYKVDLDNDGIYGELASCGNNNLNETVTVPSTATIKNNQYLKNAYPVAAEEANRGLIVNTNDANKADAANSYYFLNYGKTGSANAESTNLK